MTYCSRCVLPATFPGIRFDETGVCNFCLAHKSGPETEQKRSKLRETFTDLSQSLRASDGIHVVLAYSGGKDSTYTLWLLRTCYHLRVLAITLDNGYVSPRSFENIHTVCETLDVDALTIKPPLSMLNTVFVGSVSRSVFPRKSLVRASPICSSCMALTKNVVLRIALERRVPVVAYGWSPGQAPLSAALFRLNPAMLRSMYGARTDPLKDLGGPELDPYLVSDDLFDQVRTYPYSVNPLAFHPYDEDAIRAQIQALGWTPPDDTDGNSTNCLLNGVAIRLHLAQYGFHPYAFEVAEHVRSGLITRDEGFRSLGELGSPGLATQVAARLGIDETMLQCNPLNGR